MNVEVRLNRDGSIDEIVSSGLPIHLEEMDDDVLHLIVGDEHFCIESDSKITVRRQEEKTKGSVAPLNVQQIVADYLEVNGYDGLYSNECGCRLGDLMPCGNLGGDCAPGHFAHHGAGRCNTRSALSPCRCIGEKPSSRHQEKGE